MKKITKMFLMLLAIGAVAFGVTGCGEKKSSSGSSSSKKSEKAKLDETDPKAVVKQFFALMGQQKFDEAKKLWLAERQVFIEKFAQDIPDPKRNNEVLQFFQECTKIGQSFDSCVESMDKSGNDVIYKFSNLKAVVKVSQIDGKYRIIDMDFPEDSDGE